MIPRLKLQDWHNEVAERGERETERLEALWAQTVANAHPLPDVGEEGLEAAAFALLGEDEAALVRRALIEGLYRAMQAAHNDGDYETGTRVLAIANALEPRAADIKALEYWAVNGGSGGVAIGLAARGVQPYKPHTPTVPAPVPSALDINEDAIGHLEE